MNLFWSRTKRNTDIDRLSRAYLDGEKTGILHPLAWLLILKGALEGLQVDNQRLTVIFKDCWEKKWAELSLDIQHPAWEQEAQRLAIFQWDYASLEERAALVEKYIAPLYPTSVGEHGEIMDAQMMERGEPIPQWWAEWPDEQRVAWVKNSLASMHRLKWIDLREGGRKALTHPFEWDSLTGSERRQSAEKQDSEQSRFQRARLRYQEATFEIVKREEDKRKAEELNPRNTGEEIFKQEKLKQIDSELEALKPMAIRARLDAEREGRNTTENAAPPVPGVTPADTTRMVAWKAAIIEGWESIEKKKGTKATAHDVLNWCRTDGPRDVFGCEQGNTRDSVQWIDRNKNIHPLQKSRIGTVISELRGAGILPAKR